MTFEQSIQDMATTLGAPVAPAPYEFAASAAKSPKQFTGYTLDDTGERVPFTQAVPQVPDASLVSENDARAHGRSLAQARRDYKTAFFKLAPADQLKLSALALAGNGSFSVRESYDLLAKLPAGRTRGLNATAEQLTKGLSLAKAEGLELEAVNWTLPVPAPEHHEEPAPAPTPTEPAPQAEAPAEHDQTPPAEAGKTEGEVG
jgi:hypothetical protein